MKWKCLKLQMGSLGKASLGLVKEGVEKREKAFLREFSSSSSSSSSWAIFFSLLVLVFILVLLLSEWSRRIKC